MAVRREESADQNPDCSRRKGSHCVLAGALKTILSGFQHPRRQLTIDCDSSSRALGALFSFCSHLNIYSILTHRCTHIQIKIF